MQTQLPVIDKNRCTACSLCVTHCPTQAVTLVERKPTFFEPILCSYCGICEEICPTGAVSLVYEISLGN